jgi:hypothetical protein
MNMAAFAWIDTRSDFPEGHFEIDLPPAMRPVDRPVVIPSAEDSPVSVARFRTDSGPRLEIEVVGLFLRREIAPADMLEVLLRDYEIVERRRVASEGGDHLEALTRKVGDYPYLSRWRTVKDGGTYGGRLYLIEARAAEDDFRAADVELARAIASFRLTHPTPWPFFEQLTLLSRERPNDFALYLPESWKLEIVKEEDEALFLAQLWQVEDSTPLGRITVISTAGVDDPMALLDVYERSLRGRGAEVRWDRREEAASFGGLTRVTEAHGRATLGTARVDLHVHVGSRGAGMFLIGLSGHAREVDPIVHAINERALAIGRATMRTR